MTESLEKEHLTNPANLSFENVCPKCHNTGWVIVEDGGQGTAVECECGFRQRMIHSSRLKFADIPDAFQDVRLNNFKKSVYETNESKELIVEIAKTVRYWIHNLPTMKKRGIGLYFYSGTKGSGKTRLAISIANELIEKYNTQVKFCTSLQVLEEIKKSWEKNSESKLISQLINTEVLIIDDFGIENNKEWKNEKFYSIINGRYIDKKITIFTSNYSLEDLDYDERITNRIKERVLQVPFPEESVRELISKQLKEEIVRGVIMNEQSRTEKGRES